MGWLGCVEAFLAADEARLVKSLAALPTPSRAIISARFNYIASSADYADVEARFLESAHKFGIISIDTESNIHKMTKAQSEFKRMPGWREWKQKGYQVSPDELPELTELFVAATPEPRVLVFNVTRLSLIHI